MIKKKWLGETNLKMAQKLEFAKKIFLTGFYKYLRT